MTDLVVLFKKNVNDKRGKQQRMMVKVENITQLYAEITDGASPAAESPPLEG